MATTYTANPTVAAGVSDQMRSTGARIQSVVTEMNNLIDTVLSDWEDDARNAYFTAQAKWNGNQADATIALNAANSVLDRAMTGYVTATKFGAATFAP